MHHVKPVQSSAEKSHCNEVRHKTGKLPLAFTHDGCVESGLMYVVTVFVGITVHLK